MWGWLVRKLLSIIVVVRRHRLLRVLLLLVATGPVASGSQYPVKSGIVCSWSRLGCVRKGEPGGVDDAVVAH